jgi:16S rRNA (uracil1498-N3)-methyltransferase
MRQHRAYVEALTPTIRLSPEETHHLHVLRAQVGDSVRVFDGRGREGLARILLLGEEALLELESSWEVSREPPVPIELWLPLLKGDHLAEIVRGATELGATAFHLFLSRRTIPRELSQAKLARLQKIAQEAAKQCQRNVVPRVAPPLPLSEIPSVSQGLVAQPGSTLRVREALRLEEPVTLLTGPEGGLDPEEVELLSARGFIPVQLGPRILRAETAPLALLALVTAGEGR